MNKNTAAELSISTDHWPNCQLLYNCTTLVGKFSVTMLIFGIVLRLSLNNESERVKRDLWLLKSTSLAQILLVRYLSYIFHNIQNKKKYVLICIFKFNFYMHCVIIAKDSVFQFLRTFKKVFWKSLSSNRTGVLQHSLVRHQLLLVNDEGTSAKW